MSANKDIDHVDLQKPFVTHHHLAQVVASSTDDSYLHMLDVDATDTEGIIRRIPWLEELVIPSGLTYRREPPSTEKTLFNTYYVENKDDPRLARVVKALTSIHRLVLLLGEPGSGKTTLINYLYRHSRALREYVKTHFVVIVTCNTDYGILERGGSSVASLQHHVAIQLSDALNGLTEQYNCTEKDIYEDMDQRAFVRSLKKMLAKLRAHEELDAEERLVRFDKLLEGHNYVQRVLKWFERHHPELTIDLVIDNLDCFKKEEKEECIRRLLPMCRHKNTKLVIPLRYRTYSEIDRSHTLHQYSWADNPVSVHAPGFRRIAQSRLQKTPDIVKLTVGKEWPETMRRIAAGLGSREVVKLFNGLYGDDTREKLKTVRRLLENHRLESADRYSDPDRVLEAIMLGPSYVAIPPAGNVHNLLRGEWTAGFESTLVQVRVLQLVGRLERYQLDDSKLMPELVDTGYALQNVRSALNLLLRRGLLGISQMPGLAKLPRDWREHELVLTLTPVGEYYISELLLNPTYLTLCAQCASIRRKFLRRTKKGKCVADLLVERILSEDNPEDLMEELERNYGNAPFVSLPAVIDFLQEEEDAETAADKKESFLGPIASRMKGLVDAQQN
ncbi:hypothetical protein ACFLSJ_07890 [Verrucomicrobiota bacterium]